MKWVNTWLQNSAKHLVNTQKMGFLKKSVYLLFLISIVIHVSERVDWWSKGQGNWVGPGLGALPAPLLYLVRFYPSRLTPLKTPDLWFCGVSSGQQMRRECGTQVWGLSPLIPPPLRSKGSSWPSQSEDTPTISHLGDSEDPTGLMRPHLPLPHTHCPQQPKRSSKR